MKKVVIASGNRKKLKEILDIIGDPDIVFETLDMYSPIDIKETGKTFFENAMIKAATVSKVYNVIAMGEDSGLSVDALAGQPGIYSKRYSGENATDAVNNELLLKNMKAIPREKRTAHFIATVVVYKPGGAYITAEGRLDGIITDAPAGTNGFGYDPVFFVPQFNKTVAQMTDEEKNAISHRKQALMKIKQQLKDFL